MCAAYVVVVFVAATVITWAFSDWWPDRTVVPALQLAAAVSILTALSLAGSVVLSSTANGIAVFMLFGAGLVAGLLGQIGEALGSRTLDDVANVVSWALPFEALYQAALSAITVDTVGFTRLAIDLGPFGGAEGAGPLLWPYALAYVLVIGAAASRRSRGATCERRRRATSGRRGRSGSGAGERPARPPSGRAPAPRPAARRP